MNSNSELLFLESANDTQANVVVEELFMEDEELTEYEKLLRVVVDRLEDGLSSESPFGAAIPSGFSSLDSICSGFLPGELIILGGLPAIGKTSLAFNISSNMVFDNRKDVFIISPEAKKDRLMERFLCSDARIPMERVRTSNLNPDDWPKLTHTVVRFSEEDKLRFGETNSFKISEIVNLVEKENSETKIDFLLVDGIQNIKVPGAETKATELAEVARTLKSLALNQDLIVLACSHLNRNLFQRPNKRPVLTDILGAGSVEHDADIILFIYYDQYEPMDTQFAEVLVSKNRNGRKGTARLAFFPDCLRFEELDADYNN